MAGKPKTEIKDMVIKEVSFVDAGANQRADIKLFKRKDDEPSGDDDPEDGIVNKLAAAVKKAVEPLIKAVSFKERLTQANISRTADEIWDYSYYLQSSLVSILYDEDIPEMSKGTAMAQSVTEFIEAVGAAIPNWSQGKLAKGLKADDALSPVDLEIAKRAVERLGKVIGVDEPAGAGDEGQNAQIEKGDLEDVKIDKSKLTEDEVKALEAMEKKAGIDEPEGAGEGTPVEKKTGADDGGAASEEEDVYKGLHPAVKAEMEAMRKQLDKAADKELLGIAKKYEPLGKKPEELLEKFKSLKKAGGTAYDDMIALLDTGLEAVEKSGLFNEVGRSGHGGTGGGGEAWAQIEKKAQEIQKNEGISRYEAIEKACDQNPELRREYEAEL